MKLAGKLPNIRINKVRQFYIGPEEFFRIVSAHCNISKNLHFVKKPNVKYIPYIYRLPFINML